MSFSDNIIRSKDGNWQIVIYEDAEGAHIRCTGNVPKSVKDAVEKREHDGKCNSATELRFFARLLVNGAAILREAPCDKRIGVCMKEEDREELAKSLVVGICVFCCVLAAPLLVKIFGWLMALASYLDNNL